MPPSFVVYTKTISKPIHFIDTCSLYDTDLVHLFSNPEKIEEDGQFFRRRRGLLSFCHTHTIKHELTRWPMQGCQKMAEYTHNCFHISNVSKLGRCMDAKWRDKSSMIFINLTSGYSVAVRFFHLIFFHAQITPHRNEFKVNVR
jgi:hypothetical protein